ncbi:MAG: hypothetical protein WBZ42_10005 [Halobacteriota archaeon]
MLSLTMLAPLLSVATGMSVTWVFKLIVPLLFALVPLGLYRLYQKQTSHVHGPQKRRVNIRRHTANRRNSNLYVAGLDNTKR